MALIWISLVRWLTSQTSGLQINSASGFLVGKITQLFSLLGKGPYIRLILATFLWRCLVCLHVNLKIPWGGRSQVTKQSRDWHPKTSHTASLTLWSTSRKERNKGWVLSATYLCLQWKISQCKEKCCTCEIKKKKSLCLYFQWWAKANYWWLNSGWWCWCLLKFTHFSFLKVSVPEGSRRRTESQAQPRVPVPNESVCELSAVKTHLKTSPKTPPAGRKVECCDVWPSPTPHFWAAAATLKVSGRPVGTKYLCCLSQQS